MKKSLVLFFFGFCLCSFSVAQDSVWYRYDLTYYKIQTATEGIYRIPASRLTVLSIPLKRIDPRYLRLYHRVKEVDNWVVSEQDRRVDSVDYL